MQPLSFMTASPGLLPTCTKANPFRTSPSDRHVRLGQCMLLSAGWYYVFSAFGWSYVAAQIPGGWMLDRFGSKTIYFWSIFIWSLFTLLQGSVGILGAGAVAVTALFALRLLVGLAEAPSFPANGRIVAAWFPANERGTASAIFNSAQ